MCVNIAARIDARITPHQVAQAVQNLSQPFAVHRLLENVAIPHGQLKQCWQIIRLPLRCDIRFRETDVARLENISADAPVENFKRDFWSRNFALEYEAVTAGINELETSTMQPRKQGQQDTARPRHRGHILP
jgi:hypothetical protein